MDFWYGWEWFVISLRRASRWSYRKRALIARLLDKPLWICNSSIFAYLIPQYFCLFRCRLEGSTVQRKVPQSWLFTKAIYSASVKSYLSLSSWTSLHLYLCRCLLYYLLNSWNQGFGGVIYLLLEMRWRHSGYRRLAKIGHISPEFYLTEKCRT